MKKYFFILTTCLGIGLFSSTAKAHHIGDSFELLKKIPNHSSWVYWYVDTDSVVVNGNTVEANFYDYLFNIFSWEEAQTYGMWINPHFVVEQDHHLFKFQGRRAVVNCSEYTFRTEIIQAVPFIDIGFALQNERMGVTQYSDTVTAYNQKRDWPERPQGHLTADSFRNSVGEIISDYYYEGSPVDIVARMYCP